MSLFSQVSKIAFKRKPSSSMDEMRVMADSSGKIANISPAFATQLGLSANELTGRNLLDVLLFEEFPDVNSDRSIFNNMSKNIRSAINIPVGEHRLLIGPDQTPTLFYFDWVKNKNGSDFLVASVQNNKFENKKSDWQLILNKIAPQKNLTNKKVLSVVDNDSPTVVAPEQIKKFALLNKKDADYFATLKHNMMCVIARDGTIIRANGMDTQSKNFLDIIYEEDCASIRQVIQTIQSHDIEDDVVNDSIDFEARLKSNSQQWINWTISKKDDHIYCLGSDITSTKSIELSLQNREHELSEAQALASMGHWRWNVGSTDVLWSDEIYKIFGVQRDDFSPTLDNANQFIHKRDIGRMMQAFQRAIIEQNNYDIDFRIVREDKSTCYVRCEGRCELDADGDAIALYGIMQDVTKQTEHEMQLRNALNAAERAYHSKSKFLANMSHELRTPLNAIIGFSDMINKQMLGPLGNEKYLDYASNIHESGEHLLSLIVDILDMSKIEAGKYELDLEEIQLSAILNSAIRMIEGNAKDKNIKIFNNSVNSKSIIVADRRATLQIILNILSNAVKFTNSDGKIDISFHEFDNHVSIKIADNGIGIPANKLAMVTSPFEQISSELTRNHQGSGLGLAITKELIELHDGTIILESAEGIGTTVSVRIPKRAH